MGIGSRGSKQSSEVVERHRGLVGRTTLVSLLTLVSRLLGFVREVVTAHIFGDTSAISDAFFTAWRVPNLFRRLFGEGALSTSLQTVLTETDADHGPEAGRRLFLRTLTVASIVLSVLCVVGMFAIAALPDRMPGTDWAWFGANPAPIRDLCVRLFPYVLLVCVAALCGGALQVRGHFIAPNASPAVMNVVWIVGLLITAAAYAGAETSRFEVQWEMARWVAWGVLVGGVFQLAILIPALVSHGLSCSRASAGDPRTDTASSVRRVLKTSVPLALGAAVYQINVLIDGLMAEGLLRDGGPTALYYANRVQQFPLALVATATVTAVFPSLKAHAHVGELETVRDLHGRAQMGILFLALPAAVGLWVLSQPIAEALFLRGNYGADGTGRIANALGMLALALVPAGAAGFCGRTFIALGDYRTPVRIAAVLLVLNVGLNLLFVLGLNLDVEGLALATAVTSWASLVWMASLLRLRIGGRSPLGVLFKRTLRMALCAAVCGGVAAVVAFVLPWTSASSWRGLIVGGTLGASAYFACARALGLEEWGEFSRRFTRRLRR